MLEHLGQHEAAMSVEKAIASVLEYSGPRTADIGGKARTTDVGSAIASEI